MDPENVLERYYLSKNEKIHSFLYEPVKLDPKLVREYLC